MATTMTMAVRYAGSNRTPKQEQTKQISCIQPAKGGKIKGGGKGKKKDEAPQETSSKRHKCGAEGMPLSEETACNTPHELPNTRRLPPPTKPTPAVDRTGSHCPSAAWASDMDADIDTMESFTPINLTDLGTDQSGTQHNDSPRQTANQACENQLSPTLPQWSPQVPPRPVQATEPPPTSQANTIDQRQAGHWNPPPWGAAPRAPPDAFYFQMPGQHGQQQPQDHWAQLQSAQYHYGQAQQYQSPQQSPQAHAAQNWQHHGFVPPHPQQPMEFMPPLGWGHLPFSGPPPQGFACSYRPVQQEHSPCYKQPRTPPQVRAGARLARMRAEMAELKANIAEEEYKFAHR